jgi:hypothetical protein
MQRGSQQVVVVVVVVRGSDESRCKRPSIGVGGDDASSSGLCAALSRLPGRSGGKASSGAGHCDGVAWQVAGRTTTRPNMESLGMGMGSTVVGNEDYL